MRQLRVATVGFDNGQGYGIRQALEAHEGCSWVRLATADPELWTDTGALVAALDDVDVLVSSTHAPRIVAALSEALPRARCAVAVVAPLADELLGHVRLGDFDAGRKDLVAAAAGDLARAGAQVPPALAAVLRVAGDLAHAVGPAAGNLRDLCLVQQCFTQMSPDNLALALDLLGAACVGWERPDRAPTRHPEHGFWTPDGIRTRPELAGTDPIAVITCSRLHACGGNDAHLRALADECRTAGLEPLVWFGGTEHVTADLGELFPRLGVWLNATGFTLTGHHGDPQLPEGLEVLRAAGVPALQCLVNTAQTGDEWLASRSGVGTVTLAMQVAVPELQGIAAPLVLACRDAETDAILPVEHQPRKIARLAKRWATLRLLPPAQRRLAIVLVAHDPDKGKIGVASQLDTWRSLWIYLGALRDAGWDVEVPESPEALRAALLEQREDAPATTPNVAHRYPARDYVREYPFLERVVDGRGAPPGEFDTDGEDLFLHGAHFGSVFVCCQPSMGYGGDPASLLFNEKASPTHVFAAFYTWLHRHFDPHLLLHFGTHGVLEFLPGKQAGLEHRDFSEHLIGDVPHLYLYVTTNPSEAMIAKRRTGSTMVSYLSAPLGEAGLYDELGALRDQVQAYRAATAEDERATRLSELREKATALGLDDDVDPGLADVDLDAWLDALLVVIDEVADSLIAVGLHVLGEGVVDVAPLLRATAELGREELGLDPLLGDARLPALVASVVNGNPCPEGLSAWHAHLADLAADLAHNEEVPRFVAASDGQFVEPAPGGDPIRQRDVLPTGRNTFSVNPQHVPSARALRRGRVQADALLEAASVDGRLPECVSLVMWGVDTIKTMGEAAAQFFALIGVEPQPDASGRVTSFRVIPVAELGRPRVDCVVTTTGVFRDLFTCVMELMDTAARAVAALDEADEDNFVAKHARETAARLGCSLDDAAERIFSNQPGNYGSGVNHVVDAGAWDCDDDLGGVYLGRQSFSYGRVQGRPARELMAAALSRVEVSFQNVDGAEQSIADNDHYFEYLGGLAAAVKVAGGKRPRIFVADNYSARAKVRGIEEAMRLESRTRLLNPRWYEGMLAHGYQGVSEIGHRLDNTYGWSATVDAVDGWIYSAAANTYLFDEAMRERLAALNPQATKHMAERLQEAVDRGLWDATDDERDRLADTLDHLDDVVEGLA